MLTSESKLGTSTHTPVEKMIQRKSERERGRGRLEGGRREEGMRETYINISIYEKWHNVN